MQRLKVYLPHILLRKISEEAQKRVITNQKHSKEKSQDDSWGADQIRADKKV